MELVLVPREKSDEVMQAMGASRDATMSLEPAPPSMFDELFIDLGAEDDTDKETR